MTLFAPFLLGSRFPSLQLVAGATLADVTAGHLWGVALLTLVIAVAGYVWLAQRFDRMEVPPPLPKPYLLR